MNINLERRQIEAIALNLRALVGDDDVAYADMLEGESDLHELVRRLLNSIERDEGNLAALKTQVDERKERAARAETRIDVQREAIMSLMEAARLDRLSLPEATLSCRDLPPKPIVTDEAALPPEYVRVKTTPDMTAIRAGLDSGADIPGVALGNGSRSITIRRR